MTKLLYKIFSPDKYYYYYQKPCLVVYDTSMFTPEHEIIICGYKNARRWCYCWVFNHPNGKAGILKESYLRIPK